MGKDSSAGESALADVVGAGPRSERAARRTFTAEFKRAIVAE
jgi:transposase-like protein